jgi:large subunit ribosomal protein L25
MLSLTATIRTQLGRKSKKLRRDGYLPGVLYGRKVKSTPLSLVYKDFERIYGEAGESSLISLEFKDQTPAGVGRENVVLIRDAVLHPLKRRFEHVDFYQVPMDEEIVIPIPLVFINESSAVQGEGAVLVRNVYEITVRALPKDLPRELSVDLSKLEHTNDTILAKDLSLPAGVKCEAGEDFVIAFAAPPRAEEVPVEAAAPAPLEEIKTEGETKREEAAKEKAEEEA